MTAIPKNDQERKKLQQDFIAQLQSSDLLDVFINSFVDTYFYVKNLEGQFILIDESLATSLGFKNADEAIGGKDNSTGTMDHELVKGYLEDDKLIFT